MDANPFLTKHRTKILTLLLLLAIGVFGYGAYNLVSYSLPMAQDNPLLASQSRTGDKSDALYLAAAEYYKAGNYDYALVAAKAAYSACNDGSGKLPDSKQKLASDIQLLVGNVLVKQKKTKPAIEAYQQSLRHDPGNLYAKYNLELLQNTPPPAGGGGGGDSNQPGGGTKGVKKGI